MIYPPFIPYQTKEDKARQLIMATRLSQAWNFTFVDQGDRAIIDYKCYRDNKLVGLLEIKSRFDFVWKFDTYMCTTKDIDAGLWMSKKLGVPCILSVKWDDYWAYLRVTRNDYPVRKSNQRGRNDPRDYDEPCYIIPLDEFTELKIPCKEMLEQLNAVRSTHAASSQSGSAKKVSA